jgi:hypothetical protein
MRRGRVGATGRTSVGPGRNTRRDSATSWLHRCTWTWRWTWTWTCFVEIGLGIGYGLRIKVLYGGRIGSKGKRGHLILVEDLSVLVSLTSSKVVYQILQRGEVLFIQCRSLSNNTRDTESLTLADLIVGTNRFNVVQELLLDAVGQWTRLAPSGGWFLGWSLGCSTIV